MDRTDSAFIYDVFLAKEARGQGFGKKLISLAEYEIYKLGFKKVGLHVFGHNELAIRMYQEMGFRITNLIMMKDL